MDSSGEIEHFWEARDIQNVTIKVHGLRSSARIIGALALASFAELLEKAGQAGDVETLQNNIDRLLVENRTLGRKLMPLRESEEETGADELSEDAFREICAELRSHVAASDFDAIEAIGEKLETVRVSEAHTGQAESLRKAISQLDFDQIPAILEEIGSSDRIMQTKVSEEASVHPEASHPETSPAGSEALASSEPSASERRSSGQGASEKDAAGSDTGSGRTDQTVIPLTRSDGLSGAQDPCGTVRF